MSEKSPEDHIKDAMHSQINAMLGMEDDITRLERDLSEMKKSRDKTKTEAKRFHHGLLAMVPSTEADFDKYVLSYKRANHL